ncbi:MAG: LCP family protein [Eggerthellaceae bacterium]|nr:LCP family protein [Eggerthellaceae bacterium]
MRVVLLVVAAIAVVLAAAAGVFWLVYKGQIGAKLYLDDPSLSEVLTVSQDEDSDGSYYVLVAGEFNDPAREYDGPHLLTLTRVDPQRRQLTFISLPSNIEMVMSDDSYHVLSYARVLGGNAELVTQVENLAKVEIAHFVQLDANGFVALIDALGGLDIDLEQEADDPDTGPIYLPRGPQTLDGQQALTLVRCDNYATPLATRAKVQGQVMEAIVREMLAKSRVDLTRSLDAVAENIQTDMSFDDVWSLVDAYGQGSQMTVYSSIVPGQLTIDPDGVYYSIYRSAFDSMIEAVGEGRNPDEASAISGLTPSLVKVSVKNGAGVPGGASQLAETLTAMGYQVPETGNADNYVYDETLVVYKDELMRPTADDILAAVGNGRVIDAGSFYQFDTDILVVIGKDWKPTH